MTLDTIAASVAGIMAEEGIQPTPSSTCIPTLLPTYLPTQTLMPTATMIPTTTMVPTATLVPTYTATCLPSPAPSGTSSTSPAS